ncbi:methylmalonyl-CoA/ethylmalonyl-CoA epimerase [Rhodococcus triatomae]|uniref:Methylmalonyl-CoA/ethylmalonyl-CoA epimerase n=1 Tax=Rhodococcus triatomae TaxID=300028 RepID=A0A1G8BB27_9NOCA|nr:methylmalonyl-CoA/ethylmalonyl-CoA epimerase [Rhodococcus triatomae]
MVWSEEGIHHLGFVVDDLEFAARALEEAGSPIWMGGIRDGVYPFGVTYHRDPLGQVIELLDRRSAARLSARSRTRVDTIIQERRDSCPSQEK